MLEVESWKKVEPWKIRIQQESIPPCHPLRLSSHSIPNRFLARVIQILRIRGARGEEWKIIPPNESLDSIIAHATTPLPTCPQPWTDTSF